MNKTIVIVGGSAGAKIAAEIFKNQYEDILFLETYSKEISGDRIVADKIENGLGRLKENNVDYFIATGENHKRKDNFDLIYKNTKKQPVNCIHQSVIISESAKIGYGNLICPGAIIHTDARIGNCTIINTSSVVEHDCVISDFAQVSPNATLSGYVKIGEYSFISSGSTVIPKVKIGNNTVIAAGAVVTKDTEDNKMYAGVPAVFKKEIK